MRTNHSFSQLVVRETWSVLHRYRRLTSSMSLLLFASPGNRSQLLLSRLPLLPLLTRARKRRVEQGIGLRGFEVANLAMS